MKLLLLLIVGLAAGSLLMRAIAQDSGYVLIQLGNWTLESSVVMLALAIIAAVVIMMVVIRLIARLLATPQQLRNWGSLRQIRNARRDVNKGLIALAEGRWNQAETLLARSAKLADTPLINYLAAARAAQQRGDDKTRDKLLQEAHASMPETELAVGLSQAELQLLGNQNEQALATLVHLRGIAPKHEYVLRLLYRTMDRLEDWDGLAELLPALSHRGIVDTAEATALSRRIGHAWLQSALAQQDRTRLDQAWTAIPTTARTDPDLVNLYVQGLLNCGEAGRAEAVLRERLPQAWSAALARRYGLLNVAPGVQLKAVESWLEDRREDPDLLLSAGRIAIRNKLWGKARAYLESAMAQRANAEACQELAALLSALGEDEAADKLRRRCVALATGREPLASDMDLRPRQSPNDDVTPPSNSDPMLAAARRTP